jgi:predicted nucleic acid-binding protein
VTAVADTSVLIDYLRGHDRARRLIEGTMHAGHRVAASVLTKVEILGWTRPTEEAGTRATLGQIAWIEVSDSLAEGAAAFLARFGRSHSGIELTDYVIAATAVRLDAPLWTHNVKHFPMFPDLEAPD